jgi:WD40 repeat protein
VIVLRVDGGEGSDWPQWEQMHGGSVTDMDWAYLDRCASASIDHTCKVWNPDTGQREREREREGEREDSALSVSVAVLTIQFLFLFSGAVLATLKLRDFGSSVRMSLTKRDLVFVGDESGCLVMRDTVISSRAELKGHSRAVRGLCISEDGTTLASCSDDRTVRLWDTTSGNCLWTSGVQADSVCSVAMHGDMVFFSVANASTMALRRSDTTAVSTLFKAGKSPRILLVAKGEMSVRCLCVSRGCLMCLSATLTLVVVFPWEQL